MRRIMSRRRWCALALAAASASLPGIRVRAQQSDTIWQFENVAPVNLVGHCVLGAVLAGFEYGPDRRPVVAWREENQCGGTPRVFWTRTEGGVWNVREFGSENRTAGGAKADFFHEVILRPADGNPFLIRRDVDPFNNVNTYRTDLGAYPTGGVSDYIESLAGPQTGVGVDYALAFAPGASTPEWTTGLSIGNAGAVRLNGVSVGSGYQPHPALAVTPDGVRHVLWNTGNLLYYTRQAPSDPAPVTSPTPLFTNINRNGGEVRLAADASGSLHAVVRGVEGDQADYDKGAIVYFTSSDGGQTWSAPEYIDPVHDAIPGSIGDNADISLALDANGIPAVTYWRFNAGLWYARRDGAGGTWTRSLVTEGTVLGAPRSAQVRFDDAGQPVVAFYDMNAGLVRLARPVPAGSIPIDLAVSGSVSPAVAQPGALLTYTLTVTNQGTTNVDDVVLTNELPTATAPVDATPQPVSSGRWSLGMLTSGASTTVTVRALAPVTAGDLVDGAKVSSDGVESDETNNTAAIHAAVWPPQCFVPAAGLADLWRGDGNTLNAIAGRSDLSVSGTPAVNGVIAYAPAVVGSGFSLNGTTSLLADPIGSDNVYFAPDGSLTLQAWIKTTAATGVIGSRNEFVFYLRANTQLFLYLAGGHLTASLSDVDGNGFSFDGTRAVNDGAFHHVALVLDRAKADARLYVDGTLDTNAAFALGPLGHDSRFVIGGYEDFTGAHVGNFTGIIDEFAVHNRALTDAELHDIATAPALEACGAPPNQPPSVAALGNPVTHEGEPVLLRLVAVDPEHDPLTFTLTGLLPPGLTMTPYPNGSATESFPHAEIRGTPPAGSAGTYTGSLDVSDGHTRVSQAFAWTVKLPNRAPVARPDAAATFDLAVVSIPVLANDEDADGDSLTVVGVTSPLHGSAHLRGDQTIDYEPRDTPPYDDTFGYTISDGNGETATALVTVRVLGSVSDVAVSMTPQLQGTLPGVLTPVVVTVTNTSTQAVGNVVIRATLPSGSFVDSVPKAIDPGEANPRFSLGTIGPGAAASITLQIRALSRGLQTITAQLMSADADADPNNNAATATLSVEPEFCFIPQSGLVAHWGANGGFADDGGQFPAGGNINQFAQGRDRLAFLFDAANDVVEPLRDDPRLHPSRFTVAAWAFADKMGPISPVVADRGRYLLGFRNGHPSLDLYRTDPIEGTVVVASILAERPVEIGRWVHLAATFDETSARLYVDGVDSGRATASLPLDKTGRLTFGGGEVVTPFPPTFPRMEGRIDDITLYDRALTAADASRMLTGVPELCAPPGAPGISVAITALPVPAVTRGLVTYAVTVTNTGSGYLEVADVLNELPPLSAFIDASPAPLHMNGTPLEFRLAGLVSGESGTIVIRAFAPVVDGHGIDRVSATTVGAHAEAQVALTTEPEACFLTPGAPTGHWTPVPRFTAGRRVSALLFEGGSESFSASWPASPVSTLTFGAWVRPIDPAKAGWQGVMVDSELPPLRTELGDARVMLGIIDGHAALVTSHPGGQRTTLAPGTLPRSTWTHLAGTFDGSTARLYVDGALAAETPIGEPLVLKISKESGYIGIGRHFEGLVEDATAYDRTLTADEIPALMNLTSDFGLQAGYWTGAPGTTLGRAGYAFSFNNDDNVFQDAWPESPKTAFTFNAWIRPADPARPGWQAAALTSAIDPFLADLGDMRIMLGIVDGHAALVTSHASGQRVTLAPDALEKDVWYHLAGSFDGDSARLYVNGALVATARIGEALVPGTDGDFIGIGRRVRGLVEDVIAYDRALAAGEIAALIDGSPQTCLVNETPVLDNPGPQVSALDADVALAIKAVDPDNGLLSFSAVNLPAGLAIDPVTGRISGRIAGPPGTQTATVTVFDGKASNSQSFDWTVKGRLSVHVPRGGRVETDRGQTCDATATEQTCTWDVVPGDISLSATAPGLPVSSFWWSATSLFTIPIGTRMETLTIEAGGVWSIGVELLARYSVELAGSRGSISSVFASTTPMGAGADARDYLFCGSNTTPQCTGEARLGSEVFLTGFDSGLDIFTGWSGACEGAGAQCRLVLDRADLSATATYVPRMMAMTVNPGPGGNVRVANLTTSTLSVCDGGTTGASCVLPFRTGEQIQLTPFMAAGFSAHWQWGGATAGRQSDAPVILLTADNISIDVLFLTPVTLELRGWGEPVTPTTPLPIDAPQVTRSSWSCVSQSGDAICTTVLPFGYQLDFSPTPLGAAAFREWSGACAGTGRCSTGNDQPAMRVIARFALPLTAQVGAGGTLSGPGFVCDGGTTGKTCVVDFPENSRPTLAVAAGIAGVSFTWGGELAGTIGATGSVRMNQARGVSVTFLGRFIVEQVAVLPGVQVFAQLPSPLATFSGPSLDLLGHAVWVGNAPVGSTVLLTAQPPPGYVFAGWAGDCAGTSVCALTITHADEASAVLFDGLPTTPLFTTLYTSRAVPVIVTVTAHDPEFEPLTAALYALPSHGTVVQTAPMTFTYRPDYAFVGSDTFSYTVTDGHGTSAPGNVTVFVRGNTATGSNITVAATPPASGGPAVTVTFSSVTNEGETSFTTLANGTALQDGFSLGQPPLFFDISTTAHYTAPVIVCIDFSAQTFTRPSQIRLLHYEDFRWVDRTVSVDLTTHTVCASTPSLSPFVVAEAVDATGRMEGAGRIAVAGATHAFEFDVAEPRIGVERGRLRYSVKTPATGKASASENEFVSTSVTAVSFRNASVVFGGTGRWNGTDGYTFELRAADRGEPGRGRDTFAITITGPRGVVVGVAETTLVEGNIQSQTMSDAPAKRSWIPDR